VQTSVLTGLAEELGTDAAKRFVHNFADLWPVRRARIHAAIRAQDCEAAMDAVLSLRSGALMAGAMLLAGHADLIRTTLLGPGCPAWEQACHLLAALDDLGERTVKMLRSSIASWPQCPGNNR
jgi:hypothetical protein